MQHFTGAEDPSGADDGERDEDGGDDGDGVAYVCASCDCAVAEADGRHTDDDEFFCDDCYADYYTECPECTNDSREMTDGDACPHCGYIEPDEDEDSEGDEGEAGSE